MFGSAGGNLLKEILINLKSRFYVIAAALLALFLGALDTLVMGVATASHQFARTLGGTIGIGLSGSFVTAHLSKTMDLLMNSDLGKKVPLSLSSQIHQSVEILFRPDMQSLLAVNVQSPLQEAVAHGVTMVFWAALIASIVCLLFSYKLPSRKDFS